MATRSISVAARSRLVRVEQEEQAAILSVRAHIRTHFGQAALGLSGSLGLGLSRATRCTAGPGTWCARVYTAMRTLHNSLFMLSTPLEKVVCFFPFPDCQFLDAIP